MLQYRRDDNAQRWEYVAAWCISAFLTILWNYSIIDVIFAQSGNRLMQYLPFQIFISGWISIGLTLSIYYLFQRLNKIRIIFWIWISLLVRLSVDTFAFLTFKDITAFGFSIAMSLLEGIAFQYVFKNDQNRFLYGRRYPDSFSQNAGILILNYTSLIAGLSWIAIIIAFGLLKSSGFKP